ncbi:MAG: ABC transporter substrate-binding protein [Anaerolineae bacterium]
MTQQVFVARERELAQLNEFLDRALAGQGTVCFVTGEAGSGKTALLTEFARRAQEAHADLLVAIGDCNAQTGIGDPYLPFREVLGLLTGDVEAKLAQGAITQENAGRLRDFLRVSGQALVEYGPDLIDIFVPGGALATRVAGKLAQRTGWIGRLEELTQRQAAGPGDLEQAHVFEQYTDVLRAMVAQQPLMLVVDDLQWADAASISLLFHLTRRIGESHILLLGAYRPDEVALGRGGERHPLEKVLTECKRYFGGIWVDLEAAKDVEGRQFVDALLDTEPNRLGEGFRQALFRHTLGHPLFTIELLRDMQERGDLVQDEESRWIEGPALDWKALPARVEGVIEERIGRLEEELRDILAVAAVEGEDFTAQVVARVQEIRERRLLRELSRELEKRHHLVREREEVQVGRQRLSRYQFAHTLFQRYLYNDLSAGERRLLHGEIAEVLEDLYAEWTDEITVQLARHYAEAGEGEKAVHYLLQAGDRARGLYAHQEAIGYYERALGLLKEQGDYEQAARTLMKLGLTYHTAFDFQQARQAYEEGFVLWQRAGEMQPSVPPPLAPHAMRVRYFHPPKTLDPAMAGEVSSGRVIRQLFSGLVELTPEMDVVPDVARGWEVLEGGRKYVFHLRDDVRWSDGIPVTAGDFEYAWKRVLDPSTQSPMAGLLYDVTGARAWHRGDASDPDRIGVRALDDVTLVVELERPTGYLLQLLGCTVCFPVPRHLVEVHGETWTEGKNLVTNGPFQLEAWNRGESMLLLRKPEYHRPFTGNLERVELSCPPGAEWSAQLERYEADSLDVLDIEFLPLAEMNRTRQRHAGKYVSLPQLYTWSVVCDVSRPPFHDRRVRQALALAVDKERLMNEVMVDWGFPATGGLVPPGMPGHSPGIGLPYNPQRARQLLVEAGYPAGRGFPRVDLWIARGPLSSVPCEYVQAQWRENLGVSISWEEIELETYSERMRKEPPHLRWQGWVADYPDPDNFLRNFIEYLGRRNETYEHLIQEARRLTDQAERMRLYAQADKVLVEEAAIMPMIYGRSHLLLKPWVRRYPMSAALGSVSWKDVIIEPH